MFRMKTLTLFAALIVAVVACSTSNAQEGVAGPFCVLANGQIHASCDTGDVIVTDARFIESFAIDGTTLAAIRRMEDDTGRLFVIDLNSTTHPFQ